MLVIPLTEVRRDSLPLVGGKGANLGELAAAGFPVPASFCVTTTAYREFLTGADRAEELLAAMAAMATDDLTRARALGAQMRAHLTETPIPPALRDAIREAWHAAGAGHAYAVRSSATAEDLPEASFAGQQDTYLNVRGDVPLLEAVRRCWASLFTDRAILYRARGGYPHDAVALSVVVQRMVQPDVAGILFTADPLTGHRHITAIDAGFGLGEALVSGLVSADRYRVDKRTGRLLDRHIADKHLQIRSLPEGGVVQEALSEDQRTAPSLTDQQAEALSETGSRIEAHYGSPQDIEWCFADGELFILQARPITSLFPLPHPAHFDPPRLYVSISHMQVMTDPMSPLGINVWQLLLPFGKQTETSSSFATETPYLCTAGGRMYLDITPALHRRPLRHMVEVIFNNIDPLIAGGIAAAKARLAFTVRHREGVSPRTLLRWGGPLVLRMLPGLLWRDPRRARAMAPEQLEVVLADALQAIEAAPAGAARIETTRGVMGGLLPRVIREVFPMIMPSLVAHGLLTRLLVGVDPADRAAIERGLEGNITTEMNLAVGDLADLARPHAALSAHLINGQHDQAVLGELDGGPAFLTALHAFLSRFGARGLSEIDAARPRYRDDPAPLLQFVAGNLHGQGDHRARHARLKDEAEAAIPRIIAQVGPLKRPIVRRILRVYRVLFALREHPKFMLVRVIDRVRRLALEEAAAAGIAAEDAFLLRLDELAEARTGTDVRSLLSQRRAQVHRNQCLVPPRVMTDEGEILMATHTIADLPEGALAGSAASAGVVEGIARVITDPTTEMLHAGEILIAPFTDPGWTPLFIHAAGLVMEVGGVMTHGSVVAREYGIPAVVCVPGATTRIRTGDRVRVNGDRGFVEILATAPRETHLPA